MGQTSPGADLLKTLLVLAGIGLLLWLVLKADKGGGTRSNPNGAKMTKSGKKRLRRFANTRRRDSQGRFV
jgi:threonine/homoserine/homoserine lactone efflux protein